jgi:hypothetical protein
MEPYSLLIWSSFLTAIRRRYQRAAFYAVFAVLLKLVLAWTLPFSAYICLLSRASVLAWSIWRPYSKVPGHFSSRAFQSGGAYKLAIHAMKQ